VFAGPDRPRLPRRSWSYTPRRRSLRRRATAKQATCPGTSRRRCSVSAAAVVVRRCSRLQSLVWPGPLIPGATVFGIAVLGWLSVASRYRAEPLDSSRMPAGSAVISGSGKNAAKVAARAPSTSRNGMMSAVSTVAWGARPRSAAAGHLLQVQVAATCLPGLRFDVVEGPGAVTKSPQKSPVGHVGGDGHGVPGGIGKYR